MDGAEILPNWESQFAANGGSNLLYSTINLLYFVLANGFLKNSDRSLIWWEALMIDGA